MSLLQIQLQNQEGALQYCQTGIKVICKQSEVFGPGVYSTALICISYQTPFGCFVFLHINEISVKRQIYVMRCR